MFTGRNDPCPCGSGRKYKRCHGALDREPAASPNAARATVLKARDTELAGRLMRFARRQHGLHWLQDVLESEGFGQTGELSEFELPLVVAWLQHFRTGPAGVTLAEELSAHARERLSPDDALLLAAYRDAWMSIWEVQEVEPGIGSRLRDVLTHEERFVLDVRSSSTLERFDTMLAIVLTCDGVSFFGGLHMQPLPPRFAERAVREARRTCRVRTRPVAREKLRDPNTQLDLVEIWSEAVEEMRHQPPPIMNNTDGDPIQLTSDDFALVASREEVARGLASVAGVQEPEEEGGKTVFTVTKAGNKLHRSWDNTIIARIVLSGFRLTVETNSTRRADALRSAIETQLRGLVRFRLRKEQSTAHLMAAAQEGRGVRATPPRERHEPEMLAQLLEFREEHMRSWLDDSIPALGGLTPREAARLPRVRPKLETLLKEFEQSEARQPEQQRMELRWLWVELGFA